MPPSAMSLKRIHREVADLKKEDLGPIVLAPSEDNVYLWKGSIPGPEGSVYEGGVFNFEVSLAPDYPFSAPRVTFKTRIYHMNISELGNICIDILKHNWSPALSLFKVMLSLSSLLTDPNPKDPLVPSIANQYMRNRKTHDTTARQWTELYARPKPPPPPPPPSTSTSTAVSSPSTRSKGKRKAQEMPNGSRSTAEVAVSSTSSEPIVVEDSDEETNATGSCRRTRAKTGKRKRAENADVNLTANLEEGGASKSSKKRAVGKGRTPRNSSANVGGSGDVIILED